MKYLICLALITYSLASCLYIDDQSYGTDDPAAIAAITSYCMYDPLPYDYPMRYCDSYSYYECCFWEDKGASWECSYEWCFYWDTCSWEYVESDCEW